MLFRKLFICLNQFQISMKKILLLVIAISAILSSCEQIGLSQNSQTPQGPQIPLAKRQWALKAWASTAYGGLLGEGNDDWSPSAATGSPDVSECKDNGHAWAPEKEDMGEQWLELEYDCPVYVSGINIHETYGPGAVKRIELINNGIYNVVYECMDSKGCKTKQCPRYFEINFGNMTNYTSDRVRIILDTDLPGWNEIDAVELVGYERRWHLINETELVWD